MTVICNDSFSSLNLKTIQIYKIGALTSKVYAFKARPWEVKLKKTIDITNNLGIPISAETKNGKILRLLPRYNKDLEHEWCSDIARYIHEANNKHRLAFVYSKNKKGIFKKIPGVADQNLIFNSSIISLNSFDIVFGQSLDNKNIYDLKTRGRRLGADFLCEFANNISKTFASNYSLSKKLQKTNDAESIYFFGVNPKEEATSANLVYRLRFLEGNFKTYSLGNPLDLSYNVQNYGSISNTLVNQISGRDSLNHKLKANSFYAYGDSLNQRKDANSLQKLLTLSHKDISNGLVCFSSGANSYGSMHLGFSDWKEYNKTYLVHPDKAKSFKLLKRKAILCETPYLEDLIKKSISFYPMQSYLERKGIYIRYDGLCQKAYRVVNFGLSPLQNFLNLSNSLKYISCFSYYRKAKIISYLIDGHNCGIFSRLLNFNKKLKQNLTCIKCLYGNIYTSTNFITRSTCLYNLGKLHSSLYWSYL